MAALQDEIEFYKYSGTGNDFIIIDNREKIIKNAKKTAIKLCYRRDGIGADGLLLVEKSRKADFKMRIINPDGSEAAMCGNGARCIAHFAFIKKIAPKRMQFETKAGIISAYVKDSRVKVKLSPPHSFQKNIKLRYKNRSIILHYINTGVPHTVIFVDELKKVNVEELGRYIRYHKRFAPAGTNVNFVKVIDGHNIQLRTYERGVEAETLACGTGATASTIIGSYIKNLRSPVTAQTASAEKLKIYFSPVYLEGKISLIFKGKIFLKKFKKT